jgi:hypothetical protein
MFFIAAAIAASGVAQQLCVATPGRAVDFASDCVAAEGRSVAVAAASAERRLVWLTQDGLAFGTLAAGAREAFRPERAGELTLDIRLPASRRAAVTVGVAAGHDEGWRWTWSARDLVRRHTLQLPEGRYTLELSAAGFRTIRETVEISKKPLRLPPLALRALPAISGTVELPDGKPAVGVVVSAGERVHRMTDLSGHFSAFIEDDWPETISVYADGFATKTIEVPRAEADVDLGVIKLVRGGSLAITIDGDAASKELRCELLRGERVIRTAVKKASATRIPFEALEPGSYQLRLRGSEPLQVFVRRVRVEAERVAEVPLTLTPRTLTLTTFLGNEKLPDATVWFRSADSGWESSVKTDSDGRAVAELWQPGRFLLSAETATVARLYADFVTVEDVADPDVTFRLPDRKVHGVVVDAGSGSPVPHAEISLETARPGPERIGSTMRAVTDDHGRFVYRVVAAGHQKVGVTADGFLRSEPVEFDLQDADAEREISIPLKRGVERRIVVVDGDDVPIGNAVVAETAAGRFIGYRATDYSGKLAYQLGEREERTLFIVPPNGSFAVAQLRGSTGEGEAVLQRVVVPSPLATLDVTTRTRAGTVVANIWFLLRYNGQIVPLEVMQILDQVQGLKFFTGATGNRRLTNMPLGTYELWPAMGGADAKDILMNAGPAAPVRLELTRGENSAVLTFASAR